MQSFETKKGPFKAITDTMMDFFGYLCPLVRKRFFHRFLALKVSREKQGKRFLLYIKITRNANRSSKRLGAAIIFFMPKNSYNKAKE